MTTMKDVIELHRRIKEMDDVTANIGDAVEFSDTIGEYMNVMSDKAEGIVLEKVKEEDLVEAINGLTATLIYGFLVQRGEIAPIKFMLSGDMQPFIHTLLLATIGMLIDEGVL